MPIRLKFDPLTGEVTSMDADTPEEAAGFAVEYQVKKRASYAAKATAPKVPTPKASKTPKTRAASAPAPQLRIETGAHGNRWDEATVARYLAPLTGNSGAFMAMLIDRAVMDSDEMAIAINIAVSVTGPIVRTLTSQADKLGMKAPFTTELLKPNGKRYHIVKPFRDIALALANKKRAA
jgi:hypothetical protein